MPDELSFTAPVRSVGSPNGEARLPVTFGTRAAYYWVAGGNLAAVESLTRALSRRVEVTVSWDPVSMEITDATLADA